MTIVGLSGLWEILEASVAQIASPSWVQRTSAPRAMCGDAQKDMAPALCGALLWLAVGVWSRRHSVRSAAPPIVTKS
jgi:hypothetical protein